jgi:GntR family transcriptional repressor for pyruvate dehydrogenase complex
LSEATAFDKVRREPVYAQVAEQIRAAIQRGAYLPGEALPTERDLATEFGVSRTTIREALRAVEAQGLLRGGRGAPVRSIVTGSSNVLEQAFEVLARNREVAPEDLVDLRSCLESGAIQRGVLGARPRWDEVADALDGLREALARQGTANDELHAAYDAFHLAVVASSGSPLMRTTMRALQRALHDEVRTGLRQQMEAPATGETHPLVVEHLAILEALRAGDAERAQELVRQHDYDFFFRVFLGGSRTSARPG